MVYIAHDGQVPKTVWFEFSRDKKKQINVSHNFNFLGASCQAMGASLCDWFFLGDCHFLPAILPQVWLLIHKSTFSTMLTNSLYLSLIDPSSTGKGEGWTSPNYRNTGGRGPPPGGGPRRFISPSDILACLLESCLKTVKSTIQHDVKIQTHGWVWRGPRWCGLATSSCDGWRMRLKTHSPCFHWTVVSQGTSTCLTLHAHCPFNLSFAFSGFLVAAI